MGYCVLYFIPHKIVGEWHSVTQGDMFALLTCFHNTVSWEVFTDVTMGPLDKWSKCLFIRRWETLRGSENPVHNHGSSQKWCILRPPFWPLWSALCSWLLFFVQSKYSLRYYSMGFFLYWREVLKNNPNSWRSLSLLKFTTQTCLTDGYHFISLSSSR